MNGESRKLALALLVILAVDLAIATYALFRGPFPVKVTLGTPLAYRNIYLHVPIAVSTYAVLGGALVSSLLYLIRGDPKYTKYADAFVKVGLLYGAATLATGSAWASESWGTPWNWDPKQTAVLLLFLAYLLYFPLKNSISDPEKRAQVAASYAIASYALVPMSFLASRVLESLHPTTQAIGQFTGGGAGGALLGPRILLLMSWGILLALAIARGDLRLPKALPPAIALFGIVLGLIATAPLLQGGYERVIGVDTQADGRVSSLELSSGRKVVFNPPAENPITPPLTREGESTLLGHLVRVEDDEIRVLPHWSTPFTYNVYTLLISTGLFLATRSANKGEETR